MLNYIFFIIKRTRLLEINWASLQLLIFPFLELSFWILKLEVHTIVTRVLTTIHKTMSCIIFYNFLLLFGIIWKDKWVSISSTGKISNSCIRDLGFNPRLHQKLIGVLVWWQRAIIRSGRYRLKLSQKKKNVKIMLCGRQLFVHVHFFAMCQQ